MLINELSKRTGISIATLRYYETYGLFKGTANEKIKTNNYKYYDEDIIEKINLIKGAKEVGFTLAEIKDLLEKWDNKKLSTEKKIAAVQSKIKEVDVKIQQLKEVKKLLTRCTEDIRNGTC
ncbi:MerR family transcriptional regulator [Sphingobacterium hungaricum]|uniref:MerR family transcriptional regulator n=1 Tax=Sphingobacterium hungaricum TaxID=2082723 RepID=A0A928YRB2_9SPHI|nr:MerR family transcriptional regulator [Sphingobacterium hungaricum]MBE8714809.1 MerR family transcriptional regulator [Sphingobacterium hungaricum]